MKTQQKIKCVQFLENGKVISPILITIREYADFLWHTYDGYTCQLELEIKSNKDKLSGKGVESHPGTKIGNYFDRREFRKFEYHSWFFSLDCTFFHVLHKMGICERRDAIPFSVHDEKKRRMVRLYTKEQIELYVRENVDPNFQIVEHLLAPRNIHLKSADKQKMDIPTGQSSKAKKSLLGRKEETVEVSISKLEQQYGKKVVIVS